MNFPTLNEIVSKCHNYYNKRNNLVSNSAQQSWLLLLLKKYGDNTFSAVIPQVYMIESYGPNKESICYEK